MELFNISALRTDSMKIRLSFNNTVDDRNPLLPVTHPTNPYWRSEFHWLDSHRSTRDLPTECDILIIGAGMAGVSVAYHLSEDNVREAAPSIVLLEARQVCSGATGRNGGHVKVKTKTLLSLIAKRGPEAGEALAAYVAAQINALRNVVQKENLDCEFELRRSYDVFLNDDDVEDIKRVWAEAFDRGDRWIQERDFVGEKFAERLTSVRDAKYAINVPACSLWPYKFVTQLLERAMRKNPQLNLQTETPVLRIENLEQNGVPTTLVHTDRGVISAGKVIFATNGYTAGLLPQYRGIINPYKGIAAHLASSNDQEPVYPHLSYTYNIDFGIEGQKEETVDYLNPRPDGSIVVGGAGWLYREKKHLWENTVDDSTLIGPVMEARYFENYMQRIFQGWEGSDTVIERVWSGIMASTPDGIPHAGTVPQVPGVYLLAGFNGGGNALIFLLSRGVAQMVAHGKNFEDIDPIIPRTFKSTLDRMNA